MITIQHGKKKIVIFFIDNLRKLSVVLHSVEEEMGFFAFRKDAIHARARLAIWVKYNKMKLYSTPVCLKVWDSFCLPFIKKKKKDYLKSRVVIVSEPEVSYK